MLKKFIGFKGLFIHRNKAWRWQIRFQKKIRTITIGDISKITEKEAKEIISNIDLKEMNSFENLKQKIIENKIRVLKNKNICFNVDRGREPYSNEENIIINPQRIFNIKNFENEEIIYCKDILPIKKGITAILSGKGGSGKSFLILQEAIQYLYENQTDTAFLWLAEDSSVDIKNRITHIMFYILKIKKIKDIISILNRLYFYGAEVEPIQVFDKSNKLSEKFLFMLDELKKYDFIVLDPLSSFFSGDENSNNEMNLFIKTVSKYSAINKKIFFVLHHHSKNGQLRGAIAFREGVRLHYSVVSSKDNNIIVEIEKDNINMKKFFLNKRKIQIFKEISKEEIEKNNSFLKELEIIMSSNLSSIEESTLIQLMKNIKENTQNKYWEKCKIKNKKEGDISNNNQKIVLKNKDKKNFEINPFNKKTENTILKIMD